MLSLHQARVHSQPASQRRPRSAAGGGAPRRARRPPATSQPATQRRPGSAAGGGGPPATSRAATGEQQQLRRQQAPAAVEEWDVVEYRDRGGRLRLGLVVAAPEGSGSSSDGEGRRGASPPPPLRVEPLVLEDEAGGWWAHDEGAALEGPEAVPRGEVVRVVRYDYSQRQDKVGPGNPHGEHAHDVFLPLVPLAPGVFTGR